MGRLDFLAPMHAFGERYELPIPLYLFVLGGVLVVIASFAVTLRRQPAPAPVVDVEDVVPALVLKPLPAAIGALVTVAIAVVGCDRHPGGVAQHRPGLLLAARVDRHPADVRARG